MAIGLVGGPTFDRDGRHRPGRTTTGGSPAGPRPGRCSSRRPDRPLRRALRPRRGRRGLPPRLGDRRGGAGRGLRPGPRRPLQEHRHRRAAARRLRRRRPPPHRRARRATCSREVDPERDAVLVVAPVPRQRRGAPHRGRPARARRRARAAATRPAPGGPGSSPSSTSRPRSSTSRAWRRRQSMEGRPVRAGRTGRGRRGRRGPPTSTAIDEAARYRDRMVAPVAATFVVLQAVLLAGGGARARTAAARRARRSCRSAALAMLGYLPATYLAGPGAVPRRGRRSRTGGSWSGCRVRAGRWRRRSAGVRQPSIRCCWSSTRRVRPARGGHARSAPRSS